MIVDLQNTADLFTDGDWVESKDQNPEGDVRLIQLADIGVGRFIDKSSRFLTSEAAKKLRCTYLRPGDILIARMPEPIGRACIFPDLGRPCVTAVDVSILRPSNKRVDREYVMHFINSPIFRREVTMHSKGATRKRISRKNLGMLKIDLPPIHEQRRIVARIKECMERVEEIGRLRAAAMRERDYLLESLVEAEYQNAEGEEVTLFDVCSITSTLVDPSEQRYIDLLHVGGANIETKTGKLLELKTAREEKLKSSKFVFDGSMVLYNKIRPYLMKIARPDFSGLCSADMYPLSPSPKKLTKDYLFYLLLSRNFTDYAIAGSNRAGMPKVNRNHLFAYKFILPSIEKQKRITETLDVAVSAVEELRADMAVGASETDALCESILRKAFAGEL